MTIRPVFLAFIAAFYSHPLNAQTEFAPIGAEWVYNEGFNEYDYPVNTFLPLVTILTCTGDTTINGLNYKKVNDYLIHQDNQRVFFRHEGADYLLYDFGLQTGDTARFYFISDFFYLKNALYQVTELDTVWVDNVPLKKYTAITSDDGADIFFPDRYVYYEKAGSDEQFIAYYISPVQSYISTWLRCYNDSQINFKTPRFLSYNQPDCYYQQTNPTNGDIADRGLSIAPNPFFNTLSVRTGNLPVTTILVTDALGHLVIADRSPDHNLTQLDFSGLPSGIYYFRALCGEHWQVQRVVKI